MRLHRFFTEEKVPQTGEFLVTNENLLNQWRNVLRMEEGSKAILFDGSGDEVLCEVVSLGKKSATLKIIERKKGLVSSREVTLYMALIKKDNFELVLEKATELGVSHIVPVQATRSEKKGMNYDRAIKILREASEQSGRATVPMLGEVIPIEKVSVEMLVVFDPRGDIFAREFFAKETTFPVGLLVGPEGGFTEEEIEFFKRSGVNIVTTGSTILRAETAAIVALSYILA